MSLPVEEWPIRQDLSETIDLLPDESKPVLSIEKDTLAKRINVQRFSSYKRLIQVTARVLMMYNKATPAFANATKIPNVEKIPSKVIYAICITRIGLAHFLKYFQSHLIFGMGVS